MRILQVHNYYQQAGGEDRVVDNEQRLLTREGHKVWQYSLHNEAIPSMSRIAVAAKALYNFDAAATLKKKITRHEIDIVHAHNIFPLMSPAIYYAAQGVHVPVVQTLHNYRLLCPAATLFRDGEVCEDCLGKRIPYPAALHRCYKGSLAASTVTVAMLAAHRFAGTYSSKVSAYIALSEFARDKFVEGGLPQERIHVKMNCLADDPGIGSGYGGYALFVGRLSPEKGVLGMLEAWEQLNGSIRLQIVGDGPLKQQVADRVEGIKNAYYLGTCDRERVYELMRNAAALIFPSEWYEGSPMAVIEAMACGTPVLAADQGVLAGAVENGINGRLFECGNADALADCAKETFENRNLLADMRFPTRQYFENHFGAKENVASLISIYEGVLNAQK